MSDSSEEPWSTDPNAPQIPYDLYFGEKATFAGTIIGGMLYGTQTYTSTYLIPAHIICQGPSLSSPSNV